MHQRAARRGRVAAIMPVHQLGMPCDILALRRLARAYKLPLVEDAACATGSELKAGGKWGKVGRPHGDIACFSFHPRKVLTTGDGGMLTTNRAAIDRQVRLLREHGMSIPAAVRHKAKRSVVERYVTTGFNSGCPVAVAVGTSVSERCSVARLSGETGSRDSAVAVAVATATGLDRTLSPEIHASPATATSSRPLVIRLRSAVLLIRHSGKPALPEVLVLKRHQVSGCELLNQLEKVL